MEFDKTVEHMKDRLRYCVLSASINKNAIETSIIALGKQIPKEVKTEYVKKGIGISGEDESESNMLCPNCSHVVGDYEWNELFYKYCPNCGQKLRFTSKNE